MKLNRMSDVQLKEVVDHIFTQGRPTEQVARAALHRWPHLRNAQPGTTGHDLQLLAMSHGKRRKASAAGRDLTIRVL